MRTYGEKDDEEIQQAEAGPESRGQGKIKDREEGRKEVDEIVEVNEVEEADAGRALHAGIEPCVEDCTARSPREQERATQASAGAAIGT